MDNVTFNKQVRPLNIRYKDTFGHIPRITDYSCTREEYIEALKTSLESKKPLGSILIKREYQFEIDIYSE